MAYVSGMPRNAYKVQLIELTKTSAQLSISRKSLPIHYVPAVTKYDHTHSVLEEILTRVSSKDARWFGFFGQTRHGRLITDQRISFPEFLQSIWDAYVMERWKFRYR